MKNGQVLSKVQSCYASQHPVSSTCLRQNARGQIMKGPLQIELCLLQRSVLKLMRYRRVQHLKRFIKSRSRAGIWVKVKREVKKNERGLASTLHLLGRPKQSSQIPFCLNRYRSNSPKSEKRDNQPPIHLGKSLETTKRRGGNPFRNCLATSRQGCLCILTLQVNLHI